MKINIPSPKSFLAPEGTFPATCTQVRDHKTKRGVEIRVVFDLHHPNDEGLTYQAGKNYRTDKPDEFAQDIETWLGPKVRGKEFDTKDLVGCAAMVKIEFLRNDKHDEALRIIKEILPPSNPAHN